MAFALSLECFLPLGARRTFRRLARAARVFEEEGDRVFGVSYQGEFMADKLLAGFTLARDVVLGDADVTDRTGPTLVFAVVWSGWWSVARPLHAKTPGFL